MTIMISGCSCNPWLTSAVAMNKYHFPRPHSVIKDDSSVKSLQQSSRGGGRSGSFSPSLLVVHPISFYPDVRSFPHMTMAKETLTVTPQPDAIRGYSGDVFESLVERIKWRFTTPGRGHPRAHQAAAQYNMHLEGCRRRRLGTATVESSNNTTPLLS